MDYRLIVTNLRIWVTAFLLTLHATSGASADLAVPPKNPTAKNIHCIFVENCIVREPFQSGQHCRQEKLNISVTIQGNDGLAFVERPNGTRTIGIALEYQKYENAPWLVVSSSDGVGSSHLTLMPSKNAVWTSHLKLEKSVASTKFGTCEVIK